MSSQASISNAINSLNLIVHKINSDGAKNGSFRSRHYMDAIKILQKWENEYYNDIALMEKHFKDNGKKNPSKIIGKLDELLKTGKIEEAEIARNDPKVTALINLSKVYGIGPAKTRELYEKHGITTIEQLRKKYHEDNSIIHGKQALGLKYYDDLQERIPREEIDQYNILFKQVCHEISPSIIMSINGSYRRKLSNSGDIDLMITSRTEDPAVLRKLLIKKLTEMGIIQAVFANGKKKFMGVVHYEQAGFQKSRHLDIIDTSFEHFPFAVLYFTGSGGFNSKMRAIALEKGYSMNEYCLSHKKTKKPIEKDVIFQKLGKEIFETEQDIFAFLDMEYVEPENRNKVTFSKISL